MKNLLLVVQASVCRVAPAEVEKESGFGEFFDPPPRNMQTKTRSAGSSASGLTRPRSKESVPFFLFQVCLFYNDGSMTFLMC
jgi:hypothetical protein